MCWSQMAGVWSFFQVTLSLLQERRPQRCFLLAQETSPMKTHGKNRQAMVCCALGCSSSGRGGPEMSCVTPVKGNRIHWVLPIIRIVFKNPKKNITTWVSHEILSWILYKFTVVYFLGGDPSDYVFFVVEGKSWPGATTEGALFWRSISSCKNRNVFVLAPPKRPTKTHQKVAKNRSPGSIFLGDGKSWESENQTKMLHQFWI